VAAAKKLALAKRKEGREVKVVLQRTDGNAVVQAIND
jgi:Cu/Ag efflux protein CusF